MLPDSIIIQARNILSKELINSRLVLDREYIVIVNTSRNNILIKNNKVSSLYISFPLWEKFMNIYMEYYDIQDFLHEELTILFNGILKTSERRITHTGQQRMNQYLINPNLGYIGV